MADQKRQVIDSQTGQAFELTPELGWDKFAATLSIVYTIAAMAYLGWLLLAAWAGKLDVPPFESEHNFKDMPAILKLAGYAAIGGGFGGAVSNIRSFVHWHAELNAFGRRFFWKYLAQPPLGATLAIVVYAIIRGGVSAFDGGANTGSANTDVLPMATLTALAMGTLAGYGSHKVFIWLDDKVNTLFKVPDKGPTAATAKVPDLTGKTRDEAAQILRVGSLALGAVSEAKTADPGKIGKVLTQTPTAGSEVATKSAVAVTIGGTPPIPTVKVPDLTGKTREEATQTLKDGSLALGAVAEARSADAAKIGKVITQTPAAGSEVAANSAVTVTIGITDAEPTPHVSKVKVPDLIGKTQEEAARILQDGKLALGNVADDKSVAADRVGKVISQTPAAGADVAAGSSVTITIGAAG